MPAIVLLGPQRRRPTVGAVAGELGLSGPFALITAGWQEHEGEDDELCAALGGDAINLALYQRFERVLEADPRLARRLGQRQNRLRELQELYRMRLADAMRSARRLSGMEGELVQGELVEALEMVRQLDRRHLARVAEIHAACDLTSRALEVQRHELAERLSACQAAIVAGGHVAVLLNRLAVFGLGDALREKPLIAWSAGAMAVSERIVLFHDHPPQGQGNAEVLAAGLGLCPAVLPLPDGSSRLRLRDRVRVSLLAGRFAELRPAVLDPESRLDWRPPEWVPRRGVATLTPDGRVEPF